MNEYMTLGADGKWHLTPEALAMLERGELRPVFEDVRDRFGNVVDQMFMGYAPVAGK